MHDKLLIKCVETKAFGYRFPSSSRETDEERENIKKIMVRTVKTTLNYEEVKKTTIPPPSSIPYAYYGNPYQHRNSQQQQQSSNKKYLKNLNKKPKLRTTTTTSTTASSEILNAVPAKSSYIEGSSRSGPRLHRASASASRFSDDGLGDVPRIVDLVPI